MHRRTVSENRRIAREIGCKTYTGNTCGRFPSHGGKRFTNSGNCAACDSMKQTRYYKSMKARDVRRSKMITEPYTDAQEARLQGGALKYYGMPCKAGHDGLRYARNASCVDCTAERNRQHRPPPGLTRAERWKWKHARRLAQNEAVRQILREAPPLDDVTDEPHPLLWFIAAV